MPSLEISKPKHPFDLSLVISLFQNLSVPALPEARDDLVGSTSNTIGHAFTFPSFDVLENAHITNYESGDQTFLQGESICGQLRDPLHPYPVSLHSLDTIVPIDLQNISTASIQHSLGYCMATDARSRTAAAKADSGLDGNCQYEKATQVVPLASFSSLERKAYLLQKLVKDFPDEAPILLRNPATSIRSQLQPSDAIHVFVDHSNILIGYYDTLKASQGWNKSARISRHPLSFHNLSLILERGRPFVKRVLAGSSRTSASIIEAKNIGYETCVLERVIKTKEMERFRGYMSSSDNSKSRFHKSDRAGKVEQAVDDIIYLKILESLLDSKPATLVVATGDANPAEYSPGFFTAVDRSIKLGWNVELVAFRTCIGKAWRKDHGWGSHFRLIMLDSYIMGLVG